MTKTKAQREREQLAAQRRAANEKLAGKVICETCGATLENMGERCKDALEDACDGFVSIELAMYPDGRTVEGIAWPEQIERCRKIVGPS